MEITLNLPPSAASKHPDDQYYREALVAMLYQTGDLSSKQACEVLGLARREFEEMLSRFGVTTMPDDDESIAYELGL